MRNPFAILLVGAGMISAQGSWVPVNLGTQDTLRSVYCQSRSLCFAVGDKTVETSRDSGVVFRTVNGGGTWTRTGFYGVGGPNDPLVLVNRFYSVRCLSNATCLIAGRGETPPVYGSLMLRTLDGGASWTGRGGGGSGEVLSVDCPNGSTCYLSSVSKMYKTTDSGLDWLTIGDPRGAYSVSCLDTTRCYACGSVGVTINPNDGSNWPVLNGTSKVLRAIQAIDSISIFSVGDSGTIIRTMGSDTNWVSLVSGTTRNLRSIHFLNADTGWVVGDSGTILFTGNGGADWQLRNSGTTQNLYSVHFFNSTFGFIVGAGGTLLHFSSTVGIAPGKSRQGRPPKKKQPDSPVFDTRGIEAEGPCRSCFLDTRTGIRTIGD